MKNSTVYTFWELLTQYKITIPIIQRDYVQGRKSKEVESVRQEFLKVLFNSLKTSEPVELDFIYGTVTNRNHFSPLDGQQRLTTLFLLYWYIALKEEKLKSNEETFKRFTYETRTSSKLFCQLIVTLSDIDLNKGSLSNQILNESGFYIGWMNDQTVMSMLRMLDTIHYFANEYAIPNGLFEHMTSNAPITFQFIDLDTFQLEDSLYIKMNARGKPLTPFENFKARFQHYLESIKFKDAEEFLHKMDTNWSDYFWKHKQEEYDQSFLQFFYVVMCNQLARFHTNRDAVYQMTNQGENISLEELETLGFDHEAWLTDIHDTLESLCSLNAITEQASVIDLTELFSEAMSPSINYTNRLQVHAVISYLRHQGSDFSSFERWMRFIRNITVNTIYNRVEEYMQSIQSIDAIIQHVSRFDYYLAASDTKLSGFLGYQLDQERKKAKLILKDESWREKLALAEDYPYFEGDIGFLLLHINRDEIDSLTQFDMDEKLLEFESRYKKAIAIFGPAKLKVPSELLSRALLTFGEYLLRSGYNRSFLIEGFDRDISWKRFLRNKNVTYLLELFKHISPKTVEQDLVKLTDQHTVTDWRKYFIDYPEIIAECCGNRRFIRFSDEKDILLLSTTMTNGYCKEYYSYAVYAELKKRGISCEYQESVGAFGEKYVELKQSGYTLNFVDGFFEIYKPGDENVYSTEDFEEAVRVMVGVDGVG